jgi:hypothetical protein
MSASAEAFFPVGQCWGRWFPERRSAVPPCASIPQSHKVVRPAGGKRHGAGRPKGSRALTLLAATGERMGFYEAARQFDQKALQVIVSVMMDDNQPASLRLAAANDLLDRAYGRAPQAIVSALETKVRRVIHEVPWLPPDPNDHSRVIEQEPD